MAKRPPKYALHTSTGQAYVRINGKFQYLGEYDSPESHKRYERLIAKWLGGSFDADMESLTISRLAILFVDHSRQYYRKDGEETSEVHSIQTALRPLVKKCGREKVSQFGPRKLKTVRDEMIRLNWARTGINAAVRRITRMLRWGVENELVDANVYQSCKAVTGLRRGRSEARESEPVKPVPLADVDAVRPFLSAELWTMIQLQLVSGMRPGEACIMRLADNACTPTTAATRVERPFSTRFSPTMRNLIEHFTLRTMDSDHRTGETDRKTAAAKIPMPGSMAFVFARTVRAPAKQKSTATSQLDRFMNRCIIASFKYQAAQ